MSLQPVKEYTASNNDNYGYQTKTDFGRKDGKFSTSRFFLSDHGKEKPVVWEPEGSRDEPAAQAIESRPSRQQNQRQHHQRHISIHLPTVGVQSLSEASSRGFALLPQR